MASCSFFTLLYKEIPLSSQHAMCPEIRKKVAAFFCRQKNGTHRKAQKYCKSSISIATKFLGETSLWTSSAGKRCRDLHIPCRVIFSNFANRTQKAGIHFRHHFIIFNFPFLHLIPDMPKKMKNSSRGFKITNQLSDAVVLKSCCRKEDEGLLHIHKMKHLFLPKKLLCWGFFTVFIKSFPFYAPCPSSALPSNGFFMQIILCKISQKCHLLKLFMHQLTRKEESVEWSFCFNILHASASGSGILQHHWYNFNDFFGEEEIINGGWWYGGNSVGMCMKYYIQSRFVDCHAWTEENKPGSLPKQHIQKWLF